MDGRNLRVGVLKTEKVMSNLTETYSELMDHRSEILIIMDLLVSQLNFTYQLISSTTVGIQQEDGNWTGLIGLLFDKEVDVIASRIPILPSYHDAMDLSTAIAQDHWVTLQKKPSDQNSLNGLLSPFEMEVWVLLALSVIVMIPIMFAMYHIYLKFQPVSLEEFKGTLSDYTMFVIVSLLKQDYKLRISIHSQRLLMVTWWIGGILLTTFYTANLTASLARPFKEATVNRPQELLLPSNKDIRWLTIKGKPLHALLQEEPVNPSVIGSILINHLENGRGRLVDSIDTAINLMEEKGYVWFGPYETLFEVMLTNYLMNRKKKMSSSKVCAFLITNEPYISFEYGFAFAKNSSLTPLFNEALRLIDQSGFLEFARRPKFRGKNPCSLQGDYTSRQMQVGDLLGLFYVCIVGIAISGLSFISERLLFRISELRNRKRALAARKMAAKWKVKRPQRRIRPVPALSSSSQLMEEKNELKTDILLMPYRIGNVYDILRTRVS